MNITNLFFIFLGTVLFLYTFFKVRKNLFSEAESFFWFIGALIVLVLSIFPHIIIFISRKLGIDYPPSLLFLVSLLFVLLMMFRQSQHISMLNLKMTNLTQRLALLEEEIRE